ncbi:MAG TPA: hypothetical protein VFF40_12200 [Acidimicrobiia bacterium]|nr:hypothetical protein [Acidimicrobiia bacterium]
MAIDFSLSPEAEEIRATVRTYIETFVRPLEAGIDEDGRASLAERYQHARRARFADGPDEIHQMRIAERTNE